MQQVGVQHRRTRKGTTTPASTVPAGDDSSHRIMTPSLAQPRPHSACSIGGGVGVGAGGGAGAGAGVGVGVGVGVGAGAGVGVDVGNRIDKGKGKEKSTSVVGSDVGGGLGTGGGVGSVGEGRNKGKQRDSGNSAPKRKGTEISNSSPPKRPSIINDDDDTFDLSGIFGGNDLTNEEYVVVDDEDDLHTDVRASRIPSASVSTQQQEDMDEQLQVGLQNNELEISAELERLKRALERETQRRRDAEGQLSQRATRSGPAPERSPHPAPARAPAATSTCTPPPAVARTPPPAFARTPPPPVARTPAASPGPSNYRRDDDDDDDVQTDSDTDEMAVPLHILGTLKGNARSNAKIAWRDTMANTVLVIRTEGPPRSLAYVSNSFNEAAKVRAHEGDHADEEILEVILRLTKIDRAYAAESTMKYLVSLFKRKIRDNRKIIVRAFKSKFDALCRALLPKNVSSHVPEALLETMWFPVHKLFHKLFQRAFPVVTQGAKMGDWELVGPKLLCWMHLRGGNANAARIADEWMAADAILRAEL
eukprot:TRINITY_DN9299_c0_g1_i3.p1 TRINITY_DN9299_c0_g1~~TRINITY_DN9299_c0_g1_i3.p1  ORF type:complete len:535 (-),score=98.73 TRINITY_DN9299_c0_g1_i3:92-1696(-)